MGSRQKFTADDFYYELEDKFLDELESLPLECSLEIVLRLEEAVKQITLSNILDEEPGIESTGAICGVVNGDEVYFFTAEFINYRDSFPIFHKLNEITSDEYLDYINLIKKK